MAQENAPARLVAAGAALVAAAVLADSTLEHDLDAAAALVISDGLVAGSPAGDAGLDSLACTASLNQSAS